MQGDVEYWRARAHVRDLDAQLADAAKQLDDAAARRPRHVDDAAAWAAAIRRIADELHAGPNGTPPAAPSAAPTAPAEPGAPPPMPEGSALPVEPPAGTDTAAPPDAGVPSGGVLL
jgi:hypothetical protein